MAIPSPDTFNPEALHGPVTTDHIFAGGTEQVAVMRHASSKWRTVVENVLFILGARADRFFENTVFLPVFEHALF